MRDFEGKVAFEELAERIGSTRRWVIDIERGKLPAPEAVAGWSGGQFTGALRH
ncbi:MAG: hypothetical protein HC813_00410, partial [Planctomycetes bacterium]|nr:hypothetical protein [Planctomycetota bacterium]